jgi:hypothetical protein
LNKDLRYQKENIQLRRSKVLELTAQAIPQNLIAEQLGVSKACVSLDMQYLRCTAAKNLQSHIEEIIPMRYSECEEGLRIVLRRAFEISNNPNSKTSEVLQSLALVSDTIGKLMNLSTDEKTIVQAISWIENKKKELQQELERQQKEQEQQEQHSDFIGSGEDFDGTEEDLKEDAS